MTIFMGSDELKEFYLGKKGWEPGENTVLYVRGNGNISDESPNHTILTSQNIDYGTDGDLQYIKFNGSRANGFYTTSVKIPLPMTYNIWVYCQTGGVYSPRILDNTASDDYAIQIVYDRNVTITQKINVTTTIQNNTWLNFVSTLESNGNCKHYINGQLVTTGTATTKQANGIIIGYKKSNSSDYFQGRMSEIILENKVRTAQEVADYFNQTKSNYGIS